MNAEQVETDRAKLARQQFTEREIIRLLFLKWLYDHGRLRD